jgi:hypothetical protein
MVAARSVISGGENLEFDDPRRGDVASQRGSGTSSAPLPAAPAPP